MFMGEYNHIIDAKGRLIVPSRFRESLGSEFVVTKGLDGCLFVYPNEEWTNIEEKFRNIPPESSRVFSWPGHRRARWTSREGSCFRRYCGNLQIYRKKLYWWACYPELKSGAGSAGRMPILMTIWMKLQNIWQSWDLAFRQRGKLWNFVIHPCCWMR